MSTSRRSAPVIQIHPSRRCNLRCLHCYSSSGPEQREALDADVVCATIAGARAEGYAVASFSGGEPLMYRPLREVLDAAHRVGMLTTVTSNGMLLDASHLDRLVGGVDLLAISLDGVPASHDRMRSSPRAFDTMARRLEGVRASGIPFGFIFTLTLHNVHELPWVARFALDQGASLLQVHPLEEAGRAAEALPDSRPDAVESAHAYLQVLAARAAAGERMAVHLDVSDRELLAANPEVVVPPDVGADAAGPPLAELLSPLVVEADGTVVPLQYGFPRQFVMGDITTEPLGTIAARWRVEGFARFRHLCAGVLDRLRQPVTIPLTNLYEEFAAQAAG